LTRPAARFAVPVLAACSWLALKHGAARRQSPEERCKRLDRNGDGKLSRKEAGVWPWLKTAFHHLDANRDGAISLPADPRADYRHPRSGAVLSGAARTGGIVRNSEK
jgi:hypothetical protein